MPATYATHTFAAAGSAVIPLPAGAAGNHMMLFVAQDSATTTTPPGWTDNEQYRFIAPVWRSYFRNRVEGDTDVTVTVAAAASVLIVDLQVPMAGVGYSSLSLVQSPGPLVICHTNDPLSENPTGTDAILVTWSTDPSWVDTAGDFSEAALASQGAVTQSIYAVADMLPTGTYCATLEDTVGDLRRSQIFVFSPPAPEPEPPARQAKKACVLRSPDTRILLLDHCATRIVEDLTPNVSFFKWGRELDDHSELEVSLHMKGDSAGRACCNALSDARTWRNEMVVVRGGENVWGPGPVVTIGIQREIAHLVSRDISAWLDVRLVHNDYEFENVDLTTIAQTVIEDALTLGDAVNIPEEFRDACILQYAQFTPSGKTGNRTVIANQQSAGEILQQLAAEGLDYTVINRSLIVGGTFSFGPIGPLRDEDFMGNLEISEHGLSAATKWYVSSSNNVGTAGGVDSYFGLVERGVEGSLADTPVKELNQQARVRLEASNPPPLTVNVPADGYLSAAAPVCMDVLVPGTLVDIAVRELCRGVDVRQRLTALQVTGEPQNERVAITIAPVGELQLAENEEA